jgi:AcrR family transcriptional regulator
MEEQKIDRRVRKTKKLLLHSLTTLMSQKKINKITVKELTDLADVNRGTFYLYYKDIFDMVEQVETELFESFSRAFEEFAANSKSYQGMLSFFTFVFEFIEENAELCRILLGPEGDYHFIEKFKTTIKQHQPSIDDTVPVTKLHYYRPYVVSGCIGIIQQWLEDGMKVPPKEMAVFTLGVVRNGLDSLR